MTGHITAQRAEHGVPIRTSCQALGVSQSWYYKHRGRPPGKRQQRQADLVEAVWASYRDSGFTYGSPRVVQDLWAAGWKVSVNTVADIMAAHGWAGRKRPARRSLTRQGKRTAVPDLVARSFTADAPNQTWCGDVTMITTGEGPLYLATVIDLYSRRCLGFAMSPRHDQELTIAALQMAIATRGGRVADTVWHTDRGSEYTGAAHAEACRRMGLRQSMGRVASALDNSVAEAFNSTLLPRDNHAHRLTIFGSQPPGPLRLPGRHRRRTRHRRHDAGPAPHLRHPPGRNDASAVELMDLLGHASPATS